LESLAVKQEEVLMQSITISAVSSTACSARAGGLVVRTHGVNEAGLLPLIVPTTTSEHELSTVPQTIAFLVGSGVQLDSAVRITQQLNRPAVVLDMWSARLRQVEQMTVPGHLPPVTLRRLIKVGRAAARWAQATPGAVLVVPQDVGLVYRRAIAAARRAGAAIVLLPDGAVSRQKVTSRSLKGGLVPLVDRLLAAIRVVAGRHGQMAASRPDLVLSWGPAWNEVFRAQRVGAIIDVGNPRSDELAPLAPVSPGEPRRVLLCSQPMDHDQIGGKLAQTAWYAFVEHLALTAPSGELAVRLHPAERDQLEQLPIGPATKRVLTKDTSLAHDIGACDAVVSWASTTMIEAAAASRAVVSVGINEAAAEIARGYFFQRDPRAITVLSRDIADFAALREVVSRAARQQVGMAQEYAVNVGSATQAAAKALNDYSR